MGMLGFAFNVQDSEKFNRGLELIKESLFDGGKTLFCSDNIITWNKNYSFLREDFFLNIINDENIPIESRSIIWRSYILVYFAEFASAASGDYLEIGCHAGYTARQLVRRIKFAELKKQYFLYDLFAWREGDRHPPMEAHADPLMFEKTRDFFAPHDFVKVIKGFVPESFAQGFPEHIAFAHIDLNHPDPESGALSAVLPRLSKGGVVILDDYGWWAYSAQKIALDPIIAAHGLKVLELPTGQGLILN